MKTLLLIIPKRPILNSHQIDRLAIIYSEIAQISLGSVVIPFALNKFNPILVASGLIVSIIFWILSLWLAGKIYE